VSQSRKPTVDLATFDNGWYDPGRGLLVRCAWFAMNAVVLRNPAIPLSSVKTFVLRLFGARIGRAVVIKPSVNIKYPWRLSIGDHSWIGENVWIDNLERVDIGSHVCISQGALILSGNHDFTRQSFDLRVAPIILEDGVWIGARATVTQGVTCGSHAVLAVGSTASRDLDPYTVYRGNPAVAVKERVIEDPGRGSV
jgi:putative colanic acid biosynthesis acetyltransferase WcaF